MMFGGATIILLAARGIYLYLRAHFDRVPITNRKRLLWYGGEDDEEIGLAIQQWILNQGEKKYQPPADDPITKGVQEVLEKFLQVELVKHLQFNLYAYDDFGLQAGKIFISTRCLSTCETLGQVAAILAHEITHIIARHSSEKRSSRLFAYKTARWFGFKGNLGEDPKMQRIHESEADHTGLVIMTEAGFDPQERLDRELKKGTDPYPEFLSTHPSIVDNFDDSTLLMQLLLWLTSSREPLACGHGTSVFRTLKTLEPSSMYGFTPRHRYLCLGISDEAMMLIASVHACRGPGIADTMGIPTNELGAESRMKWRWSRHPQFRLASKQESSDGAFFHRMSFEPLTGPVHIPPGVRDRYGIPQTCNALSHLLIPRSPWYTYPRKDDDARGRWTGINCISLAGREFSRPTCIWIGIVSVFSIYDDRFPTPTQPTSVADFVDVCAAIGKIDMCCVLPILEQGLICQSPS
ncbi:hypothetical protein G7Y89_g10473 [Cudoniella acicularis]|uniref:Peptidase M48 domain-containing protein n=1 Tax=Cudoniella acicularis TaxID=354080 RepID=A0A8H4RCQ4_9HELO|nr:hypothetical protein G7Y89_g10473 [Cudoniella acicularis]